MVALAWREVGPGERRDPGATMACRQDSQGSSLTPWHATAKSREVPTRTQIPMSDPSEIRVGSFHVPAGRATTVPTLELNVGAQP